MQDLLLKFHLISILLFLNEFSSDKSSKVESHDLSEEKRKEKEELRVKLEKELEEKEKKRNSFIERAEIKKACSFR